MSLARHAVTPAWWPLAAASAVAVVLAGVAVERSMSAGAGAEGARPRSIVQTVACHPLPDVPGKTLTMQTVVYPPHALTGRHRHGGSVTAYVIRGHVRSQLDATSPLTYGPGGTWFEPLGTIHEFIENAGDEDAEILAVTVADHCADLTTMLPPDGDDEAALKPR